MSNLGIRLVGHEDRDAWERLIQAKGNYVCQWAWRSLIENIYGYDHYWLMAENPSYGPGFLALAHAKHPLFGNYLTTAPFDNYGGFYAESEIMRDALLNEAIKLQRDLGASYISVRHLSGIDRPPAGWIQDPIYATYWLQLEPDPEEMWHKQLRAKERNQIQKSFHQGFSIRFGRQDLLADYWQIISLAMRELGSPFHSKRYLRAMMENFGSQFELAVIYCADGTPVGGSLIIYEKDRANHLHANVLSKYRSSCAGDFLYWSVIKYCCQQGLKVFEMGRSLIGSGNERYKMKWRPQRFSLAYWYHQEPDAKLPRLNQSNPRYQLAIRLWKQMPLLVTEWLGPHLIRGIL